MLEVDRQIVLLELAMHARVPLACFTSYLSYNQWVLGPTSSVCQCSTDKPSFTVHACDTCFIILCATNDAHAACYCCGLQGPSDEPVWRQILLRHLNHSDRAVAQQSAAALAE